MNVKLNKILRSLKGGNIKPKIIDKKNTNHIFINGDCGDVARYIPDNSIDLIITDPPYNQKLDYGKGVNDNKHRGEYSSWLKRRLEDIPRILKHSGSFYLISYPEINARLLPFLEDELKLNFRRWITWHYPTNIGHSRKNYTKSQRSILFFTKSNNYIFNRKKILQPYKNPEVTKVKKLIENGSKGRKSYCALKPSDLDELGYHLMDFLEVNLLKNVSKDRFDKKHPCQLPPELLKIFVKVSSNKIGIVLDPFGGTFTLSAVAAELDRNSLGIETNPNYIKLGLRRLKK